MFEKTNNYALPFGCNGPHFSFSYYYDSNMSIIDPLACEFAKIFCYNTFTNKNTLKKDPSENLTCYKSRLVHHSMIHSCQHSAYAASQSFMTTLNKISGILS